MALNAGTFLDDGFRKTVFEEIYGDVPDVKTFWETRAAGKSSERTNIIPDDTKVFEDASGKRHMIQFLGKESPEHPSGPKIAIEEVFDAKTNTAQIFIEMWHADGKVERTSTGMVSDREYIVSHDAFENADAYKAKLAELRAKDDARMKLFKEMDDRSKKEYRAEAEQLKKEYAKRQSGGSLHKGPEADTMESK